MPTMDDVFREALGTRQDQPAPKPGSMDAVFASKGASPAPGRPGPSLPAVAKAATLSPEEARRNQDLTAATGLPAKIVQADPDRAGRYAEAQRLRQIEREAPATARFLSSPGNMELARDAASALADMERQQQAAPRKPELTFDRFLRASGQSFLQALSDRAAGAAIQEKAEFASYADVQAYQRRLASGPMPALEGEARDAGALYWDLVNTNLAQGMPQEEAETKAAREHNARYVKRFEDIAAAPGLQMDADLAAASSGIVEDIARGFSGSLPMMLSSAFGGPVIGTVDAFTQISGAKYKELRAGGADEATARKGAFLSALGQAPLEYAGNVLQFGAVAKLLKRSGVAMPLVEAFAGNFVEEYLQAFPDAFADILAANPKLTARQLAKEFLAATPDIAASPDTLYQGLVGGIVGTLVPGAVATVQVPFRLADNARSRGVADIKRAVQEAGNAAAAEDEAGYLDGLRQMAADNPLRERSPAKFEQALAMQLEEHPEAPRDIHIDGALFQQAATADSGAYEDVLQQFGITPDQVIEAVATGGDVVIPLAKYLAVAVDTPLDAALKDDIRLRPESMTLRERGEWLKTQAEETRRIVDAAAADRQAEDRIEVETRQIYETVRTQREALGRATRTAGSDAAVWSAFLGTMARRGYLDQQFGGSPLAAFEAAWPELAGPQGPVEAAPRMAAPEVAPVEQKRTPSAPAPNEVKTTPEEPDTNGQQVESPRAPAGEPGTHPQSRDDGASDVADRIRERLKEAGEDDIFVRDDTVLGVAEQLVAEGEDPEAVNHALEEWGLSFTQRMSEEQAEALADFYASQLKSPREFHPILEAVWGRISGKSLRADYPGEYKELTRAFGPSLFKSGGLPIDEANAELVGLGLMPEGSTDSDLVEKLKSLGTAWRRLKDSGSRLFQRAFHGTPFDFDSFSLEHVGTGEGAQSYGWGLYFAGRKEVAEYYRGALAGETRVYKLDGKEVAKDDVDPMQWLAIKALAEPETYSPDSLSDRLEEQGARPEYVSQARQYVAEYKGRVTYEEKKKGRIFEAEIPEDDTMLDWDKPFAAQPPKVQNAIKAFLKEEGYLRPKDNGKRQLASALRSLGLEYGTLDSNDSGSTFYRALEKTRGSRENASRHLNSLGIKGIRYLDQGSRRPGRGSYNYVIFDDQAIDIVDALYQGGLGQGPRGVFDRAGNILALFETANESTFLHESGHVFLEFTRALAMADAADPRLREEWAAVKAELGIQDDGEIDEAAHEKWARSLEAYFLEGKAPSRRLQGVFQRFAAWLRQIYGNLARLGAKPSAKLAGLFDRLFATDQEIAEVEAMHEAAQPFFTAAEQMAREEREAYERQVQAAQESARDKSLRRYVGAYVQALGGQKAFEAEARRETQTLPAYKAMDAAATAGGMSAAGLDAYVGEEARKELAKKRVGMVRTNGGEPPDQVARDAGFASVPDMVAAVLGAEGKTARIRRRAEELQQAKEAEIRAGLDESTLPSAEEDYHTDERLAVLAAEFEMLRAARRRQAGFAQARARRMEGDAVREVARQVLAGKSVSDARRADRFSQAEIRAGKLARQARDAGSLEKAMEFKRREMLNHALVLESMRVREEIDAGVRKVRQALASKVMYQEARDLIRDIGVRFGFQPRPPGMSHEDFVRAYNVTNAQGTPRRAIDFTAWERLSGEKGYSVALPDLVTDRSNAQQFGDLSVQNFRDVLTAIDQIAAVDRQERFVKSEGEYRRREDVVRELTAQLPQTFAPGKPGGRHERASSKIHKVLSALKGADASMVKMEVLFRAIDGNELGPWFRHLFLPTAQSEESEAERCASASAALAGLMARHYGPAERAAMFRKRVLVPECGESFTRAQLLRLALDMGNQGNYSRRRDGTALPDGAPWTDAQMEAVKARLDKRDWDFVQAVWNYIDTFRKEAFALEREMTGREPERVMPEPVETPFGTYAGGYFPVVIDPTESDIQAERSEVEQALLYGTKKYSQVMTKHGYLKERKQTAGGQPLSVEFSDVTRHVFGVIHDLSHRERLVNVGKILRDKEFKAAAGRHLGKELADQLLPWAKDIANLPYEPHAWPERVFRSLRIGTTVVSLGKIGVGLQQAAGLTQSVAVLKGQSWRLLKRLPGYFTVKPFLDDLRRANDSSAFMRTRITHATREANETFQGVSMGGKLLRKPGEWMFKFIGATQKMTVDVLTWSAAYDAGLARDQDHARAVQYADHVVRVSQGGGGLKDLSALQRSKSEFVKATTMFYSFLSTAYNLMAKPLRGRKIDFAEFALTTTMLALLGPSLAELLSGRPPEDEEEWDKWAAMNSLRFGLGMLPFVRDVASPVVSEFGGYKLTPVEGTIASATRLLSLASKGELLTEKAVSPALTLTGAWLKLPTRQLEISARGAYDLLTGDPDFEPRDLIFKRSEN